MPFYTVNDHIVTVKEWAVWAARAIEELSAQLVEAQERAFNSGWVARSRYIENLDPDDETALQAKSWKEWSRS
jgi:hypothetical protein